MALAKESILLMNIRAIEKGIDLSLDYQPGIPVSFTGDAGRIRQILLNLLGNAIKFTSQGGVKISITSTGEIKDKHQIRIAIIDTGIGISKQNQSKLFDAFQQADTSTTRKFGGTGLGLAICKKLVELMDGEIGLNSTVAEGSEFWFTLCLPDSAQDHLQPNNGLKSTATSQETPPALKLTGNVLLVEDNLINQMVAQDIIEQTGLTVDIAENGIKAVQAWRDGEYDLILMDCLMPEMDGYEATRQIRSLEQDCHIPIIALTANVLNSDKQVCKDAGMDDFIGKPIELNLLTSTLDKWLKIIRETR